MSDGGENSPGETALLAAGARRDARKPAGGATTPPFSRRRPERPFVPFVGFEDVVARCGHVEKFGLLNNNGTGLVLAAVALSAYHRVTQPIILYNLLDADGHEGDGARRIAS